MPTLLSESGPGPGLHVQDIQGEKKDVTLTRGSCIYRFIYLQGSLKEMPEVGAGGGKYMALSRF